MSRKNKLRQKQKKNEMNLKSIQQWCNENNKIEYLEELVMSDEINENSTFKMNKKVRWRCRCGNVLIYSFAERLKLSKLQCKECIEKNKIDIYKSVVDTNKEENYLCKLLHTSKAEQYIYTYIKELFPDTIRGKQFD